MAKTASCFLTEKCLRALLTFAFPNIIKRDPLSLSPLPLTPGNNSLSPHIETSKGSIELSLPPLDFHLYFITAHLDSIFAK